MDGAIVVPHLLRVEAINMSSVLLDTQQLSVRRGASLLMRQAILDISHALGCQKMIRVESQAKTGAPTLIKHQVNTIEAVSTGGSIGLFQVGGKPSAVTALRDSIADWLNNHDYYCHFNFGVDVEQVQNNIVQAGERLLARIRYRQFQQWTLPLPDYSTDEHGLPCNWDNLRPAAGDSSEPPKTSEDSVKRQRQKVTTPKSSISSRLRHRYGREQKARFYAEESGCSPLSNYTWDLHELAGNGAVPALNDKIAVLSFDGNSFSQLARSNHEVAENIALKQQAEFDQHIRKLRGKFLKRLIAVAESDPTFQTTAVRKGTQHDNIIRLELLEWGGDEFTLVVPAWKGMEVLQLFFDESRNWHWRDQQLTHSAGVVFCHVKTPIRKIQKFVERELLNSVKEYIKKNLDPYSSSSNLYQYTVFESVDFPTQSFDSYIFRKFGKNKDQYYPLKPGDGSFNGSGNLSSKASRFQHAQKLMPARQLHLLARSVAHGDFELSRNRFSQVVPDATLIDTILGELFQSADPQSVSSTSTLRWLHAAELWDYFAPEPEL